MIVKSILTSLVIAALAFVPAARGALVHQWKFNGFATDSVGSADAVLGGGAALVGDRLSVSGGGWARTSPIDNTITEKTLVSWVSLNDLGQAGGGSALSIQIGQGVGNTGFDGIVYAERTTGQWMAGSNGFQRSVPDNGGAAETVTDPGEVMMAITYAADNSITIYRDGAEYASATNTSQGTLNTYVGGTADVLFGPRHDFGSIFAGNPLNGFINEARIYNTVLTPTEISDLFFNGTDPSPSNPPLPPPPPPATELVHQWTFNGDLTDSVGSADGVASGGAVIVGDRLSLDGVAAQVLTSAIDNTISERTLISWVSLNDLGQAGGGSALSIQIGGGNGSSGFDGIVYGERATRQWMAGSNGFQRSVPDNGGAPETVTEPGEVMMAIVYDSDNSITIYRDGVEYATAANTTQGSLNTYLGGVGDVIFGRRHDGAGNPLNGFINEARIYNGALDASEIEAIFAAGPVPEPTTALLALLGLSILTGARYSSRRRVA